MLRKMLKFCIFRATFKDDDYVRPPIMPVRGAIVEQSFQEQYRKLSLQMGFCVPIVFSSSFFFSLSFFRLGVLFVRKFFAELLHKHRGLRDEPSSFDGRVQTLFGGVVKLYQFIFLMERELAAFQDGWGTSGKRLPTYLIQFTSFFSGGVLFCWRKRTILCLFIRMDCV